MNMPTEPHRWLPTQFAHVKFDGRTFEFGVSNPDDAIQRTLLDGRFFAQYELDAIIERLDKVGIAEGDVIADVGANVGNHTVFLAARYPHAVILPFEPSEEARTLLLHTIEANDLHNVETASIALALSNKEGTGILQRGGANNLGNSRIVDTQRFNNASPSQCERWFQKIETVRGDSALEGRNVRFIKIDTEGHEMDVLAGLEGTISRCRPILFVEVDKANLPDFDSWMAERSYEKVWWDHRYAAAENVIVASANGSAS